MIKIAKLKETVDGETFFKFHVKKSPLFRGRLLIILVYCFSKVIPKNESACPKLAQKFSMHALNLNGISVDAHGVSQVGIFALASQVLS